MLKREKTVFILATILFIIYCLIMVWAIVFKCNYSQAYIDSYEYLYEYNIYDKLILSHIPLKEYFFVLVHEPLSIPAIEEFLNIIIFIPLGMYVSYMAKKRKLLYTFLISLGVTMLFEIIQLLTLIGSFSIYDICTNIIGGIIGFGVYKLCYRLLKTEKRRKGVNIALMFAISIYTPLLIYAFINTVININIYIDILSGRL